MILEEDLFRDFCFMKYERNLYFMCKVFFYCLLELNGLFAMYGIVNRNLFRFGFLI